MQSRERNYSGPSTYGENRDRRRNHTYNHSQPPPRAETPHQPNNNRGGRGRGRRNRHHSHNEAISVGRSLANEPPRLPGMYFDAASGRYFAITGEHSGISGYSSRDIEARQKQQMVLSDVETNRLNIRTRTGVKSIAMLTSSLQRGGRQMNRETIQRRVAEGRLMNIKDKPHSVHKIRNMISFDEITGCKFLSVSSEGTSIFGCWSGPRTSFSNCLNVTVDKNLQHEAFFRLERNDKSLQNTMGLQFEESLYGQGIADPEVVDMCIAPMDTEVTACLYVTAATRFANNQLRSRCSVFLHPLPEWSSPEDNDILSSPIYNVYWSGSEHIWSCGWSPNKMYISLGLEDSAKICNIVTDQKFLIWSKGQSVMCQKFTQDGNIIIMAPRGKNLMCSDLRMPNKHCIDGKHDWPKTDKSCFVQPLKDPHAEHILTQSFNGHLMLWDLRKKNQPVLEYEGHLNNGYKLSCVVDPEERFVFAVGADGCTRGWSIASGNLLCELPSPHPMRENSEFPRIAYSDNWGGVVGNTALAVSHGSRISLHQLDL